jgi:hypothetical protein
MGGRERGASQPIARAKTKAECMHGGNLTGGGGGKHGERPTIACAHTRVCVLVGFVGRAACSGLGILRNSREQRLKAGLAPLPTPILDLRSNYDYNSNSSNAKKVISYFVLSSQPKPGTRQPRSQPQRKNGWSLSLSSKVSVRERYFFFSFSFKAAGCSSVNQIS